MTVVFDEYMNIVILFTTVSLLYRYKKEGPMPLPGSMVVVISLSDRPLGAFRILPELAAIQVPTVPLEFVRENLGSLIGENRVHQRDLGTGSVLGYIQDAQTALDIIHHSLFLYAETFLSFKAFLREYASIPEECPVCQDMIDYLDEEERLEHIIRCRWNSTRTIVAAVAKAVEPHRFLH